MAKGPQRPLVLFPGNAEQAQRGSLGLQGRHHLSKSLRVWEIKGFFAHHLSDGNHFRRSGSYGSTALCTLPCLASRGVFQALLHPSKYGGVPFMIWALFCNVQIDIVKPNADVRHSTCTTSHDSADIAVEGQGSPPPRGVAPPTHGR